MLANLDLTSVAAAVLVGLLTAVACLSLMYGVVHLLRGSGARVRGRLKHFVVEEGRGEQRESQERTNLRAAMFAGMDEQLTGRKSFNTLRGDVQKAAISITIIEVVLIQISVGIALALVLWILAPALSLLAAVVGFLLGVMAVRSYIRYLGQRRTIRFEEQLPDTLSILASSVRGGFSLFQALQLIAREAPEPAKTEFLRVVQEISLGANMDRALEGLAARIPTEDVEILVTAINLQHQTGGNLSHMLDVIAQTVRERQRIQREIRSLTAQQRFSAILLTALPYLLAVVLFIIAPTYISRIFRMEWVLCMPVGAVIMSVVGFIAMRKMGAVDV